MEISPGITPGSKENTNRIPDPGIPFRPALNMSKNYALQGLNFEKIGQIEYSLDKIKAKMFFLHRHLFCLVILWPLFKWNLTGFSSLTLTGILLPNLAFIRPGQI